MRCWMWRNYGKHFKIIVVKYPAASYEVFGLHSVSVGAERVPPAHSAPRGIRQISARARLLGSLLAGIKKIKDVKGKEYKPLTSYFYLIG